MKKTNNFLRIVLIFFILLACCAMVLVACNNTETRKLVDRFTGSILNRYYLDDADDIGTIDDKLNVKASLFCCVGSEYMENGHTSR